jgi:hypothetical protein
VFSVALVAVFLESCGAAVPLVRVLFVPSVDIVFRVGVVTEVLLSPVPVTMLLFSMFLPPLFLASYLSPKVVSLDFRVLREMALILLVLPTEPRWP